MGANTWLRPRYHAPSVAWSPVRLRVRERRSSLPVVRSPSLTTWPGKFPPQEVGPKRRKSTRLTSAPSTHTPMRWWQRRAASTSRSTPSRACRFRMRRSTKPWRSIPCRSGPMPSQGCARHGVCLGSRFFSPRMANRSANWSPIGRSRRSFHHDHGAPIRRPLFTADDRNLAWLGTPRREGGSTSSQQKMYGKGDEGESSSISMHFFRRENNRLCG